MSDSKQDESFKVVDRRLFTAEGELRKEVAEQQDRERETASGCASGPAGSQRAGRRRFACRKLRCDGYSSGDSGSGRAEALRGV